MRAFFSRLSAPLVGATVAALVVTSVGAASHLDGFGHANNAGSAQTTLTCIRGGSSCLSVANFDPSGSVGIFGQTSAAAAGVPAAGLWGHSSWNISAVGVAGVLGTNAGLGPGVVGRSDQGVGVLGTHGAATGPVPAVKGETASTTANAAGVEGQVTSTSAGGFSAAVRGVNASTSAMGIGVHGSQDGSGWGVYGETPAGRGVYGRHSGGTGVEPGVKGVSDSTSADASGVTGELTTNAPGLRSAGVRGVNNGLGTTGIGVFGSHAGSGWGVYGETPNGRGVFGYHTGSSGDEPGVKGRSDSNSDLAAGVFGEATGAGFVTGVYGQADNGIGVLGGGSLGIVGFGTVAGLFAGNVHVTGTLTKAAGSFRIDHPLDPANRYLQHSFVESPDMKNVYDGVARTDGHGFATVRLPRYFSALNRDFRYQLTPIGRQAWDARAGIWQEISNNRFVIRSEPNTRVSWQVTGIRNDRYANAYRIQPETEKPAGERGTYLRPELYGKPRSKATFRLPD